MIATFFLSEACPGSLLFSLASPDCSGSHLSVLLMSLWIEVCGKRTQTHRRHADWILPWIHIEQTYTAHGTQTTTLMIMWRLFNGRHGENRGEGWSQWLGVKATSTRARPCERPSVLFPLEDPLDCSHLGITYFFSEVSDGLTWPGKTLFPCLIRTKVSYKAVFPFWQ